MTTQELLLKRKELAKKITTIATAFKANGNKFASDQAKAEFESTSAEYDEITDAINVDKRDRELNEPDNPRGIGLDDAGDGLVGGRPVGTDLDAEWRDLFRRDGRNAAKPEFVVNDRGEKQRVLRRGDSMARELATARPELLEAAYGVDLGSYLRAMVVGGKTSAERAALTSTGGSTGGYTIPDILSAELIDTLRAKSVVMSAGAATIRMDAGEVKYARLTGDPTPSWRAESQEITESTPTFGQFRFTAESLGVLVKAPRELLEDSVNIRTKLPDIIASSLTAELDRVALVGTGIGVEPLGVDNYEGINVVDMGTNGAAIADYSPLLDAIEAIETDNADTPTVAVMAPRTARAFAGLQDTTDQPMRRPDALSNMRFLTTTKVSVDQVQGSANDASSIFVGGFENLVIAVRSQITLQILQERYGEFNQVDFLATLRADTGYWYSEAFAKIVGIIPT